MKTINQDLRNSRINSVYYMYMRLNWNFISQKLLKNQWKWMNSVPGATYRNTNL